MKKGFRDEFKHFKRKDLPPDFNRVIDFNKINTSEYYQKNNFRRVKCRNSNLDWGRNFGMKNPSEWEVYTFLDKPGLIFIKNPFNAIGQRYWIIRCLEYYTRKPSKLNIDAHDILKTNESWWEYCQRADNKEAAFALEKLRWATFGYHHNWDTKYPERGGRNKNNLLKYNKGSRFGSRNGLTALSVKKIASGYEQFDIQATLRKELNLYVEVYSESSKSEFPTDLSILCQFLAQELNFTNFNAEAAIINMYHFGSSLSGHTDHSEINTSAPLFSFSFGQSAIFLIGGKTIDDPATAILLQSGDIIILSEEPRLCYHGVPRIVPAETQPWNDEFEKLNPSSDYYLNEILEKLANSQIWRPFEDYVKKSRINMNIRQVLLPGQKSLES